MFSSCVDDLPVAVSNEDKKLFVICEMNVGDTVIADISYFGKIGGSISVPLVDFDDYTFAIAEGETDLAFSFSYNPRETNYFIENTRIKLKPGVRYKFRGIGSNNNFTDPTIAIPNALVLGDVKLTIVDSTELDGKYITKVKCNIKLGAKYGDETYFYIAPSAINSTSTNVTFSKDFQAYKNLSHKAGFLVDYKRITDNELEFFVEVTEAVKTKSIEIEYGNVTPSFYHFNQYYSNLITGLDFETSHPAIAGLNVKTEVAYGTFSAKNSITQKYQIR